MVDPTKVIETEAEEVVEVQLDQMKNRRKIAYISLISILSVLIILLITLFFSPLILNNFSKIESVVNTILISLFGLIFTYFGSASIGDYLEKIKK